MTATDEIRAPITARLRGEPLGPQHHDALRALLTDPRVAATLGGTPPPGWIGEHIAGVQEHWREHGFGWYGWRDRATGAFVARGGPRRVHVAGRDEVEVGWTVAPERWGQGIATELGARSVALAFGPLGLAFEADIDYKGWPHVLYRLRSTSSA